MENVKQFQAAWLTITVLVWMGTANAESPAAPVSNPPGPATSESGQSTSQPPRVIPAANSLAPVRDRFTREEVTNSETDTSTSQVTPDARVTGNAPPKLSVTESATQGVPKVIHSHVEEFAPHWVTIQGDVNLSGSHEMENATIPLSELLKRSGEPADTLPKNVQIIRAGAALEMTIALDQPLLPGDLVVVRKEDAPTQPGFVRLGVFGLSDDPLAVRVPDHMATLAGIQKLTQQPQLKIEDIKVLVEGVPQTDWTMEKAIPDCAVLIIAADQVNRQTLPTVPTKHYAIKEDTSIQLVQNDAATSITDSGDAPAYHAANAPMNPGLATESATRPIGPAVDELPADFSMLPKVDSVPPPPIDDLPTRTADLSGSVSIGPAEMESHIMALPGSDFAAPTADLDNLDAAPVPPDSSEKTVGLPANNTSTLQVDEDANRWDLWPVVLMGMLVGGSSFYLLRRWKERSTRPEIPFWSNWFSPSSKNKPSQNKTDENTIAPVDEPATIPMSAAKATEAFQTRQVASVDTNTSRATFRTALISNQLPLREEPVELPATLFVQGRSTAPARRRVDVGEEGVSVPHVVRMPFEQPESRLADTVDALLRSHATENRQATDIAPEPSEETPFIPLRARRSGTPFEQALANRQRGTEPRDRPS